MKLQAVFVRVVFIGLVMSALSPSSAEAAVPTFQIVESVPEATDYGQPGVPRTRQVWLDMIRHAQHSIDIAAFYVSNKPGEALSPVLAALVKRARAGVEVHILVGRIFHKETAASLKSLHGVPHIEVRVLPMPTLTGGVLHAKYFIVDGRSVFVGSQNWDWRALDEIHEIGVRIRNTRFARTFQAVFDFDWRVAADPDLPHAEKAAVRAPEFAPVVAGDPVLLHGHGGGQVIAFPAFSPPGLVPRWVNAEQPALVRLIRSAQHMLRIQVMTLTALDYYGPKGYWAALDVALRDAAARGVKVEIIVADWALREPMQSYLKSLAALPGITVKFSHLPPAPRGFIPYARVEHCKYAIADNRRIYIGTGNWGRSYFATTIDASVFAAGRGPAGTLTKIFERDWNGPYVTVLEPNKHYVSPRTH